MDTYYRSSDHILQVWFESEEDFQVVQIKLAEKTFIGLRKATQLRSWWVLGCQYLLSYLLPADCIKLLCLKNI